jgi:quinol monooxygenase YgiN
LRHKLNKLLIVPPIIHVRVACWHVCLVAIHFPFDQQEQFMIFVIATMKTTSENQQAFVEATRECITETRKEAGCISYELHQSVSDVDTFVFVERWENREALEAHFKAPHLANWRREAGPLIVNKKVEIIDPETIDVL